MSLMYYFLIIINKNAEIKSISNAVSYSSTKLEVGRCFNLQLYAYVA